MALLETKLTKDTLKSCHTKHFQHWLSIDNSDHHSHARIWVLWRNDEYDVVQVAAGSQFMHLRVFSKALHQSFHFTVVYASNISVERLTC